MSKDSPSPPPAPDPVTTANAQSGSNISTAIANAQLNRVNQTTPWGSITYTQGAPGANGVPTWSSQIQLSPQQQALLDQQQGMQLQRNQIAQGYLGQVGRPLDLSNLHPIDMRGQMYSGAVNAAPAAGAQSVAPAQPAANSQQTSELINQILAMLGGSAAAAAPGGSPAAPPAPGAAPGAGPSGAAPPAAASPGATPAPTSGRDPNGRYGNLFNTYTSPAGSGQWQTPTPGWTPQSAGLPEYLARQFSQTTVNTGGDGGQDQKAWQVGNGGVYLDKSGARVVQVGDPAKWGQPNQPHLRDPSKVHYDEDLGYVTDPGNLTDDFHENGWDRFMTHVAIPGIIAAAGGMAGAGIMSGAAGAAGAGAEGAGAAGVGEGVGAAGSAGEAGSVLGNAGMPGYAGAFDAEGASGLAGSAYDPLAAGTAGAASGAPVTDLSVQASNPGVLQQAGSNFMNGRGLLGLSPGQRAAVGLLPSLLRAMSARNGQGGGK